MFDKLMDLPGTHPGFLWSLAIFSVLVFVAYALHKKPDETRDTLRFLFQGGNWVIFLAVLAFGFIFYALFQQESMFANLKDPAHARGVITFMIVIATITLAFMLVYQAFAVPNEAQAEAGFKRAREVFTGLMGVVGTIVGFYFAAGDGGSVGKIEVTAKVEAERVLMHAAGGTPPYQFTITSSPVDASLPKDLETKDGFLEIKVGTADMPRTLAVEVVDTKGKKAPVKKIELMKAPGQQVPPKNDQKEAPVPKKTGAP